MYHLVSSLGLRHFPFLGAEALQMIGIADACRSLCNPVIALMSMCSHLHGKSKTDDQAVPASAATVLYLPAKGYSANLFQLRCNSKVATSMKKALMQADEMHMSAACESTKGLIHLSVGLKTNFHDRYQKWTLHQESFRDEHADVLGS